ncbi:MAG: Uma2 family endonuclease [Lachnospiraceae bacterium]|nr:Uma2 family endonuclease [Lachnospiraceae bacterium]
MPLAKQTDCYTEEDYYNLPENVRAELIDGSLIYRPAAPGRIHQTILGELYTVVNNYIKSKGGSCKVYPAPFAVKLREDRKTIVEPDISVICDRNKLTDRGCTGAPDWIIEIVSPGNSSHDYVRKLNLYMDAGVREYWIVDSSRNSIFVYYLEKDNFKVTTYTFQDNIKVNIYDDLSINFAELDL